MKNNLEHSVLPSANEIKLYQEGKLEALRSHEIEILAQENPLLADALEGYSAIPAYSMLPVINEGIAHSTGVATGTAASAGAAAAVKVGTAWWHINGWLIGVIAGSMAAVGVSVMVNNNDETAANKPVIERSIDQTSESESSELVAEPLSETSANAVLPGETPVVNQQVIDQHDQPRAVSQETPPLQIRDSGETQQDIAPAEPEQPLNTAADQPNNFPEDEAPKKSSTIAIKIMHILNYKLADYTAIRVKGWEKFSLDDVGLPASFGSAEDRQKYLDENPERSVPYVNYITDCIKAYDTEKFKVAIQRFNVVLEEYPEDVNAQFYTAMSFYATREYDKAIALFSKVEKNHINTFDEEAMFYHAKALQQSGNFDEANSLFVKVVQENGFYKEQAIQEMK